MSHLRVVCFTFFGVLALAACGGSSTSSGGTTGVGGAGGSGTGGAMMTTAGTTGAGGAGGAAMPVMACSEIPAADCFSSFDCADAADRCENRGTADVAVPCCVKGARGTGKLGESCTGENDCVSALCVGDAPMLLCTDRCMADAECPAALPKCIAIAFSGSDDKFCTP
jgi:hypothetical protein